jgi:hypothetical protein
MAKKTPHVSSILELFVPLSLFLFCSRKPDSFSRDGWMARPETEDTRPFYALFSCKKF